MTESFSRVINSNYLTMPNNLPVETKGKTALALDQINIPTINDVKAVMDHLAGPGIPDPGYVKNQWDCDDRALMAIARARCAYPKFPIGFAAGIGKVGAGIANTYHALVVMWHVDAGKWIPHYFDPDPHLRKEVDFAPELIIPFPAVGSTFKKDVGPDSVSTQLGSCGFIFDPVYNAGHTNNVINFLKTSGIEECMGSKIAAHWPSFSFEDRTIWYAIYLRKAFPSAPIGVALGNATKGGVTKSYASLVFWIDENTPIMHHFQKGPLASILGLKFTPSIVFV
jgi:hypothetical protein